MFRFALILLSVSLGQAQDAHQLDLTSFERVWSTVRDRHWQEKPAGLDWQAIHEEFRPKAERARNIEEMREVMREMLGRLKQTHFSILAGSAYSVLDALGGDGDPGLDLRVLDGAAIITRLDAGGGAERAGVRLGWKIPEFTALISQAAANPEIHELPLVRSLLARLKGARGTTTKVTFEDGAGTLRTVEIPLDRERGEMTKFGNLPTQYVWFEANRLGETEIVRFNIFLDPAKVMARIEEAVTGC